MSTDAHGATRVFYTSTTEPDIGIGRVRVATPDDDEWISWTKGAFVVDAPSGLDLIAYRDPFLRHDLDGWRMFVGAGDREGTAMALSYRSADLETWTYEGVAVERSTNEATDVWMGALWECPQIIDVDGHAVMVSSVWDADVLHYVGYAIGTYESGRFVAERWGQLTFGDSYYAPSFFRDDVGRPCLVFWMRGITDRDAGWAGAHSIPFVLSAVDGMLVASPHPDLEKYRGGVAADRVDGLAADLTWTPNRERLVVSSGGEKVLELAQNGKDALAVAVHGTETVVPLAGAVRIIFDGPVLEVVSDAGLFGAAIAPSGDAFDITSGAEHAIVHALRR